MSPKRSLMGKRIAMVVITVAVVEIGVWSYFTNTWIKDAEIIKLLRANRIAEARTALNDDDDWAGLMSKIESAHDPALVQAAFNVQFEHWYSPDEDTNYPYAEHPEIIARLLALGAAPRFENLLRATGDGDSKTAWLLLRAGVPAWQAGSEDTPLANASYWGDIKLAAELLRRGADVNQPRTDGWRPVLAAAWSDHAYCVQFLLDHGADVTLPFEEYEGHIEPIWKVIQERAALGEKAAWNVVSARIPSLHGTGKNLTP